MPKFTLKLYDYNKPGKGVEKNEEPQPAFKQLFVLFFRKFGKMILTNALYFLCLLPLLTGIFYYILISNSSLLSSFANQELVQEIGMNYPWVAALALLANTFTSGFGGVIGAVLLIASAVAFGPITAGYVYCMRNAARDEHFWVSDLFSQAWKNRKQGIALGLVDILIAVSVFSYAFMDMSSILPGMQTVLRTFSYAADILAAIYFVLRFYLYVMMVTFEISIKDMFVNAVAMVFVKFPRTLLVMLGAFVVFYINAILPTPSLLLLPLIDLSFVYFMSVFIVYPVVDRYMVKPAMEGKNTSILPF